MCSGEGGGVSGAVARLLEPRCNIIKPSPLNRGALILHIIKLKRILNKRPKQARTFYKVADSPDAA